MMSPTGTQRARRLWSAVLGDLQMQVTRPSFDTWLKGTSGVAASDDALVVGAPNTFVAEMLERRMHQLILGAVERVNRRPTEVRFQVVSGAEAAETNGSGPAPSDADPSPTAELPQPRHQPANGNGLSHRTIPSTLDTPSLPSSSASRTSSPRQLRSPSPRSRAPSTTR